MVEPRTARGAAGVPGGFSRGHADLARAVCGYVALAVVGLGVWLTLIGGTRPASAASGSAPPGTVTQVQAGAALFNQTCAACHSPDGGGTLNGPDIRSSGA